MTIGVLEEHCDNNDNGDFTMLKVIVNKRNRKKKQKETLGLQMASS